MSWQHDKTVFFKEHFGYIVGASSSALLDHLVRSYGNRVDERRLGPSLKQKPWKWRGRVGSRDLQDEMDKT